MVDCCVVAIEFAVTEVDICCISLFSSYYYYYYLEGVVGRFEAPLHVNGEFFQVGEAPQVWEVLPYQK